jgi:hypothetical protein
MSTSRGVARAHEEIAGLYLTDAARHMLPNDVIVFIALAQAHATLALCARLQQLDNTTGAQS